VAQRGNSSVRIEANDKLPKKSAIERTHDSKRWEAKTTGQARMVEMKATRVPTNPSSITTGRIGKMRRFESRKTREKLPMLYRRYGKTKA